MKLPSSETLGNLIVDLKKRIADLDMKMAVMLKEKNEYEKTLYDLNLRELYINEIQRVASIQFPRLRGVAGHTTQADIEELEKWISRCKNTESLKDIIEAINELQKYKPGQIGNIYALVQKIIIEGSYHGKKKPPKS